MVWMRRTRMAALLLAAASVLGGCASLRAMFATGFATGDMPVIARGRTVIVRPTFTGADTLPTAQRYCATLGLAPSERTITSTSSSYDCS